MRRSPRVALDFTDRMVLDAVATVLGAGRIQVTTVDDADVLLIDAAGAARVPVGGGPPVIVLAAGSAATAALAFRLGARGFLAFDASGDELRHAVREVAAGGVHLPDHLAAELGRRAIAGEPDGPIDSLTDRQLEVVHLLVAGASRDEIADRLGISVATVRTHVRDAFARLGVHSAVEAASVLRRHLSPPLT